MFSGGATQGFEAFAERFSHTCPKVWKAAMNKIRYPAGPSWPSSGLGAGGPEAQYLPYVH